jgi:hypothetical protein
MVVVPIVIAGFLLPVLAFAQTNDAIEIQVGSKSYLLKYDMSNGGTVNGISVQALNLIMNVTSPSDSNLHLTFPRELYDSLNFTEHGEPMIVVNDKIMDAPPQIASSCEQISMNINLPAGAKKVELAYADILMEHTHSYPEKIELVKKIGIENQTFNLRLLTDAKRCDTSFVKEEKTIHVDIKGRTEIATSDAGYFEITIPHDLLGGNYTVLVDGKQVSFSEEPYGNVAFYPDGTPVSRLVLNYPVNASRIDIVGTKVMPEFSTITFMVIMAGVI